MTETTNPPSSTPPAPVHVQVTGATTPGIAAYAERRLQEAVADSRFPVLHARVRITRQPDPAVDRPVVAQANLDLNGRFLRVQQRAPSAREAVDLMRERLRHRLRHVEERTQGTWEDRRGRAPVRADHEWRHGQEPAHRPPYFPRPPEEREVVRRKAVVLRPCGLDEAAADLEDMGYDFHLFTEAGTGQDSVLYRSGPTGYRVAQVDPQPDARLAPHALLATVSDLPAPRLSVAEATERMAVWDRPFLFFVDPERGRGALLYHRYDGHYGLVSPAEPGQGEEGRS